GYTGTVHFTSTDGQSVLPANYTFVAGDSGTHMFSTILKTAGAQTVTATDTVTSSITGTTNSITVNPATASQLAFTTQPPATGTKKNQSFTVAVTVKDPYGNTVTTSTASITVAIMSGTGTTGAVLTGGGPVNATGGAATFSLSIDKAGSGYKLTA